jgi:hypothetical protein
MVKREKKIVVLLFVLIFSSTSFSWYPVTHGIFSEQAVSILPKEIPLFFKQGAAAIAHYSWEPDVAKIIYKSALNDREYPEHFLDYEYVEDFELPKYRHKYIALLYENDLEPKVVGYLPYAIVEWTERLEIAFAEHRKWSDNSYIEDKCLVYAGILAHYAQDLCMPLHTTMHYDGMVKNGKSPRTGIHAIIDGIVESMNYNVKDAAKGIKVESLEGELFSFVMGELKESHSLVDEVYGMEDKFLNKDYNDSEIIEFVEERSKAAVKFTATLFLTAWEESKYTKLPGWLIREK